MNRRSGKQAEEEYDEIQKDVRENPQESRCLRSFSRNNESQDNAENTFIAPRRLARMKSINPTSHGIIQPPHMFCVA